MQLREKDLSARELYDLGARLQEVLSSHRVPLLINDRLDVALALDADGVHLAGHSLPTRSARRALGPDKLLGVSTHSLDAARQAAEEGADFVVFGPVFATPSKLAYGPPQGLPQLAAVVREVPIPVLGIGGIKPANLAAGAANRGAWRRHDPRRPGSARSVRGDPRVVSFTGRIKSEQSW